METRAGPQPAAAEPALADLFHFGLRGWPEDGQAAAEGPPRPIDRLLAAARTGEWLRRFLVDAQPRPRLEVNLSQMAASQVMVRLGEQRFTGVMQIATDLGHGLLAWQAGQPVHAWSDASHCRLGSFLLQTGRISLRQMAAAQQLMGARGRPLAAALLQLGLIDAEALWQAQADLAHVLATRMALRSQGTLRAWPGPPPPYEPTVCTPLPQLIGQGHVLAGACALEAVQAALKPLLGRHEALAWLQAGARWEPLRAALPPTWCAHIERGGTPEPLQRWLAGLTEADAPRRLYAQLFVLVQAGVLGFRAAPQALCLSALPLPPMPAPARGGATPRPAGAPRSRAAALAQRSRHLPVHRARGPALLAAAGALLLVLFGLANLVPWGADEAFYDGTDPFFYVRRALLGIAGLGGLQLWQPRALTTLKRPLRWPLNGEAAAGLVLYGLAVGALAPPMGVTGSLAVAAALTVFNVVAEELFFRGFLGPVLAGTLARPNLALAVSAAVYGLYHATFFIYDAARPALEQAATCAAIAAAMGLPLAWVHRRFETLWAPILAHLSLNFCVIARAWIR